MSIAAHKAELAEKLTKIALARCSLCNCLLWVSDCERDLPSLLLRFVHPRQKARRALKMFSTEPTLSFSDFSLSHSPLEMRNGKAKRLSSPRAILWRKIFVLS